MKHFPGLEEFFNFDRVLVEHARVRAEDVLELRPCRDRVLAQNAGA